MGTPDDFNKLVDRAMSVDGRAHMRPVIEKELLHYDILFALDKAGLLETLTFQGGTSLRLCYGSSRFSEDLDFVGGRGFATQNLLEMSACLESYLGERYGLHIAPKEMVSEPEYYDTKVDKWRIGITTAPQRKDLSHQKIKIEVANIPAYSRVLRPISNHYDFMPSGYGDLLVMTETLSEIMADKLVSLVNCRRYIRYRDIWDLQWLKNQGVMIVPEYVISKVNDYRITDYQQRLNELRESIGDIVMSPEFYREMSRFIPMDVQHNTLLKEGFRQFLVGEIKLLLLQTSKIFDV